MKTFRELDIYPRILLIVLLVMLLAFSVAYPLTISRVGFQYRGSILVPEVQENQTVYSGRVDGKKAIFTVISDEEITYQWGDKTYGPYTVQDEPSALSANAGAGAKARGIALRLGEQILFRGGIENREDGCWRYNADGSREKLIAAITVRSQDGQESDQNGHLTDPEEPTVSEILYLVIGPEMKHNGSWSGWLEGAAVCALVAATIFFADDMFYLRMSMRVRDADSVEPSNWEMLSRKTGWTVGLLLAFLLFWSGIQ